MNINILIIEDSVALGQIIKNFVTEFVYKYSNAKVQCVVSIVKSLKEWQDNVTLFKDMYGTFDFVISDWLLNDGTAYKILKEIIEDNFCTYDKMAIITGYASYDSDELRIVDKPTSFSKIYDIPIYDKPVGVNDLLHIISNSSSFMDTIYFDSEAG